MCNVKKMAHYSYTLLRRSHLCYVQIPTREIRYFDMMFEGSCYSEYPQIENPANWSDDPFVMDIYSSAIAAFDNVPKKTYPFLYKIKITAEVLRKIYYVVGVSKESVCDGCRLNSFGQIAHMECPSGCLHDVNECFICNQGENNQGENNQVIFLAKQNNCEGCQLNSLGQLAHMECPSGCLHDAIECFSCEQIENN